MIISLAPKCINEFRNLIFQSKLDTSAFSINSLSIFGEQFATNCIIDGLKCWNNNDIGVLCGSTSLHVVNIRILFINSLNIDCIFNDF